jgi:hypothetical protein
VRIRLEEKFPNAFKTVKIRMHKLKTNTKHKISSLLPEFHNP